MGGDDSWFWYYCPEDGECELVALSNNSINNVVDLYAKSIDK